MGPDSHRLIFTPTPTPGLGLLGQNLYLCMIMQQWNQVVMRAKLEGAIYSYTAIFPFLTRLLTVINSCVAVEIKGVLIIL